MDPLLLLKLLTPRPMGAKGQDQKGGQAMPPAAECSSFLKGLQRPPAPQIPAFLPLRHPAVPLPFLGRACLARVVISPAWSPAAARASGTAPCSTTARSAPLSGPAWAASWRPRLTRCPPDEAAGRAAARWVPPAGRQLVTWAVPLLKRRMGRVMVDRGVEGEGSGVKCLLVLPAPHPAS